MAKKKYICTGCNKCTEPCTVELSGDADMTKDPTKLMHCGTWVEVPAEEDTNKEQRPKLTAEVFSLDDCPTWAQYAAVDANGLAYWYEDKPEQLTTEWQSNERARRISQDYDASDWKNSLIEIHVEEQLPKLTADVFSMDECPLWARYAAVDENGRAYWYDEKPMLVSQAWEGTGTHFARLIEHDNIVLRYDASDWKTSLLECPTKTYLPKITDAVFRLSECPEWAQYAAVDADGSAYWYAAKPDLGSQAWCNISKHFVARRITLANMPIRYDKTNWKNSLIERPAEQRTKLTHEVFSMDECPEWAQFAAVDADGVAYWYDTKPEHVLGGWLGVGERHTSRLIARGNTKLFYDSSDWKNSLIERRRKLTAEIFNHPECPADAVVAVVNASGTAAWGNRADIMLISSGSFKVIGYSGYDTWTTIPGGACFDATDWQHSAVYRAGAEPKSTEPEAPKLTHEVFSPNILDEWKYVIRSQVEHGKTYASCPVWARYAAVDQRGAVCVYDTKPVLRRTDWYPDSGGRCAVVCNEDKWALRFDTTDWKNSLIERPESECTPKLTPDVFSYSTLNDRQYVMCSCEEYDRTYTGCPDWARYAAVNKSGEAYVYENKPVPRYTVWTDSGGRYARVLGADKQELKFDATDWEHSLIERTAIAPKLTHEVFSMKACPAWARYAAVDANGFGYWYDEKPEFMCNRRGWIGASERNIAVPIIRLGTRVLYDSSDWEHSLIERPAAAPKLTADVFSMEECPEWARFTAVDADGVAYWYEVPPRLCTASHRWESNGLHAKRLCHPGSSMSILFDANGWKNSLIERQPAEPRQKLTTEVFSMPECPEWARYAAVDASGLAYWYDDVPRWSTNGLRWQSTGTRAMKICYAGAVAVPLFDATDWQHSLIERPAVVPDWFKPGVLAYNNNTHTCFHVTYSTEYRENYLEAKVRPLSADELARKLGQFVTGPNNSRLLVTGYCAEGRLSGKPEICVLGDKWLTAEDLLTYGSRPQGIKQYHSKEGTWIDCGLSS